MKKQTWLIIAAVAVGLWVMSTYNGLVSEDEEVKKVWGNVEASYQRRADLIPNLVEIVKGYATHEENTLKEVVEARSKATSITLDADNLDEETMKKFQEAQSQLQGALSRLMAVSEAYPDLKANEQFMQLQSQLEGTENRINEARKTYNEAVKPYNEKVRQMPGNIVAGIFGFKTKSEFQADADAKNAPKVKF